MKQLMLPLIAVMLLSASTVLTAQGTFSIGPRAGVNFANVSDVDDSEMLLGLVAGITSTYSINENSGITLDILYSGEGYKINDSDLNINYIQIPLYYDLFFGELGQKFRPKVYVGVAGGFLLNAEFAGQDIDEDMLNSFVFSATGGLGFNYQVADRLWLNVDLRAFIGLTEIGDAMLMADPAARNVQVSVGLAYGLGE